MPHAAFCTSPKGAREPCWNRASASAKGAAGGAEVWLELPTTFASCLAQTTCTAGFPFTSLWTQDMAVICTGWSGFIWAVITKRSHSELKRCYKRDKPKVFFPSGTNSPRKGYAPASSDFLHVLRCAHCLLHTSAHKSHQFPSTLSTSEDWSKKWGRLHLTEDPRTAWTVKCG